jgi:hypothetical protein
VLVNKCHASPALDHDSFANRLPMTTMFTNSLNPIKRLTDSLAQTKAQEQARQQRIRAQQRSSDGKTIFDAGETPEEASFANSKDPDQTHAASQEEKNTSPEETKTVTTADIKDTSLPKEIRIKLAKLAKYEDRHPSTDTFQIQ